jgi:LacI family transcriptional regulator
VGDFSLVGGRRAMAELLAADPPPDAVFAQNDLMALGALQAIAEAGLRVPEDVAIVGFDDSPLGAVARPPLTTVRQPVVGMGTALAEHLLAGIERGAPVESSTMPTELVLRATH